MALSSSQESLGMRLTSYILQYDQDHNDHLLVVEIYQACMVCCIIAVPSLNLYHVLKYNCNSCSFSSKDRWLYLNKAWIRVG